jgi:hypothetical protein
VLDRFGTFDQADRETDPRQADRQTVLANLLSRRYERQGWPCDVAAEIAQEVLARADKQLSPALRDVVERAG